jgi:hypothetical protein
MGIGRADKRVEISLDAADTNVLAQVRRATNFIAGWRGVKLGACCDEPVRRTERDENRVLAGRRACRPRDFGDEGWGGERC